MVNVFLQSGLFKMIGIAFYRTGCSDDQNRPTRSVHGPCTTSQRPKISEKAFKRDLKKHGIQPFVSNKDLPMTQQRCVVSEIFYYTVLNECSKIQK